MENKLSIDEQTLLAMYRSLDHAGQKELLRHATEQQKAEEAVSVGHDQLTGQCRLGRSEKRLEIAEPIFTE